MKNYKFALAVAAMLLAGAVHAQSTTDEFPLTWDFTDSIASVSEWTAVCDTEDSPWEWTNEMGNTADGCMIVANGVDSYLMSRAITIPEDATNFELKYFSYCYYFDYYGYYQFYPSYEVLVSTTTNDTAAFTDVIFGEEEGYHDWTLQSVSLSQYAGQTIYIAFHSSDYGYVLVDDIFIGDADLPIYAIAGNVYNIVGEECEFSAIPLSGDNSGNVTYTWTSAIGTVSGNDSTVTISYTAAGTDTVTLTVDNGHGTYTTTFIAEVIVCNVVNELPYSESFEDMATANCWTLTGTSNEWYIYPNANYASDGDNFLFTSYDTLHTSNCYAISPAIAMPADANGMILTFHYSIMTADEQNPANLQVMISNDGKVLSNFQLKQSYSAATDGYVMATISLEEYSGDTIYVAFHNATAQTMSQIFVDQIEVRQALQPVFTVEGPTSVQSGEANEYTATYVEGVQDSITYSWTSTMAAAGNATISGANTLTATITYTAGGTDQVIFTATNAHGSYADTINVTVTVCETIATMPWNEDFESEPACWTFYSANQYTDDDWIWLDADEGVFPSGLHGLYSGYNDYADADDWAISPAIQMPADATGYVLAFQVMGRSYDGIAASFDVMISTTGTAISDFSSIHHETFADENMVFVPRSLSLEQYAGQTIHIAFRNTTGMGGYDIAIDDVQIREALSPVFVVNGPEATFSGESVDFTATYVEGVQEGMTYNWTSTMAAAGNATISGANTLTATISYTAGGTDHVTFTATNAHGTYTKTIDVQVTSCDAITSFPYIEDFENSGALVCWAFVDADGDGYGFEPVVYEGGYGHNGSNGLAMSASYNSSTYSALDPDNWMISPAVVVPAESNLELSWYAKGQDTSAEYCHEHYSVYITTGNPRPEAFTDAAVYSGETTAEWVRQSVSLSQYAGQTIRFAFRHHNSSDMFYLDIDDVQIAEQGAGNGVSSVKDLDVSIYPNPASDMLNVKGENIRSVDVIDINGRVVVRNAEAGMIDLSAMPAGMYIVRVVSENGIGMERVIKR